jgi:SAM-dependent methyltransferase
MSARQIVYSILKAFYYRSGLGAWLMSQPNAPPGGFDLEGEKLLDWAWVVANLPQPPKRILDIGCCYSPLVPIMVSLGHEVVGIDINNLPYQLSGLTFRREDFLVADFPESSFDVIVLCSVVEHVGLAGRYSQTENPDGDLQTMRKIARLLKPRGLVLLTIPVGVDLVFAPWHRVYGKERLPRLLHDFTVQKSRYFLKVRGGAWHETDESQALEFNGRGLCYSLGQYVLEVTQ